MTATQHAKRALERTPQSERLIRNALAVGTRGAALGLDTVPGVVWVRVTDYGTTGVTMAPGQAHVEVWADSPELVFRSVAQNQPADVAITVRVRRPGWVARAKRWSRWRLFQLIRALGGDS